MRRESTCSIPGCDRPVLARGWCSSHYYRWGRYGDPLGTAPSRSRAESKAPQPLPERVCPQCGETFQPLKHNQRFCSQKCNWTEKNRKRTLKPNVSYDCAVCGKHVERYVEPSKQAISALRYCSRTCARKDLSGERHHAWKGGRTVSDQGYVYVLMPDHPHADHRGYVREHRLVMEQMIGRYLLPQEVVHHINDDPSDNQPENLMLFPNQAAHKAHEMAERERDTAGRVLPVKGGK